MVLVMSKYVKVAFGGSSHTGPALTDPITDIWSCNFALDVPGGTVIDGAFASPIVTACVAWFTRPESYIGNTESLDWVKVNEYAMTDGKQITDPTNYQPVTGTRGGLASKQPLSTTYRISLDDGTRNARARGGFFPPRTAHETQPSGRGASSAMAEMATSAKTFLDACATAGGTGAFVGVFSLLDHVVHESTRLRMGDVPDNISRRRNALIEAYEIRALA